MPADDGLEWIEIAPGESFEVAPGMTMFGPGRVLRRPQDRLDLLDVTERLQHAMMGDMAAIQQVIHTDAPLMLAELQDWRHGRLHVQSRPRP